MRVARPRWRSAARARRGDGGSYEARTFRVRSAMQSATASGCAPSWCSASRASTSTGSSRRSSEIFLDYTPLVEPLSLTRPISTHHQLKGMPLASDIAREIRARIMESTGYGLGVNSLQTSSWPSLESDIARPTARRIPPEKGRLSSRPASRQIPGVGRDG